ncbi:hypothetical protein CsSME_00001634 [Camellia sinensis var. sinensis]
MDWWGIQWVIPRSFEDLIQWWLGWKFMKKEKQVWGAVFISIVWSLWIYRNDCIFNNTQLTIDELCKLIKVRVAMWLKSYDMGFFYSIQEIVSNIKCVSQNV